MKQMRFRMTRSQVQVARGMSNLRLLQVPGFLQQGL